MTTLSNDLRMSARELFENAIAHHLAGRADDAIAAYRQTLAADPTLAPAMNNLGALLAARGHVEQAVKLFKSAVHADPAYGEAHNNLGIAFSGDGNHVAASEHFERAVALEPRRATWWNNLGNSCVECFQFERALEAYDRALRLMPEVERDELLRTSLRTMAGDADPAVVAAAFEIWVGKTEDPQAEPLLLKAAIAESLTRRHAVKPVIERLELSSKVDW